MEIMKTLKESYCELIIKEGYLRLKSPSGDILNDNTITIKSDMEDKIVDERKYRIAYATIEMPVLIKKL